MDALNACAQIRADAGPRGKKCPGGYSIPKDYTCGGDKSETRIGRRGGRASGSRVGAPKRKGTGAGAWIGAGIALGALPIAATSIAAIEADLRNRKAKAGRPSWQAMEEVIREKQRANEQFDREQERAAQRRRQAQADMDEAMRRARAEEFTRQSQRRRAQSAPPPGSGSQRARVATERSRDFAREEEDFARSFGLGSNPTKKEIKAARIRAARQYHPDQFAGDEKARKAAEKKMQEINSVVDRLLGKARSDAADSNMFVDIYSRWNPQYGCF